jgi:solute carrier family 41
MDKREDAISMILSNLALVQCQGIVVGFVASLVAVLMDWLPEGQFNVDHALLLCAASIVTASIASFLLGLVMVGVVILSRKCNINPDNVATPIAASLGDLITLSLLSWISSLLFAHIEDRWISGTIIGAYILFIPICIYLAKKNVITEKVLYTGWTPVLVAMSISSLGGLILDSAVNKFRGIAVFQPVFNGVGGNLVAVQASRISTHLHSYVSLSIKANL